MKQAQLSKIELCKLKAFEHHPYKVQDDAEMEALTESIRENGILTPLLVRPLNNRKGEYEVISGHRRMCAAEKAGLNTVPAFVSELNRADAVIMMVDKADVQYDSSRYVWATVGTLNAMTQINNCLNIQLRNLLTLLYMYN